MKKFRKILGMALALSLVITQIPTGKTAKAADGGAVKLLPRASWDDEAVKGTLVDTTTAAEAFNTATLTVECAPGTNFNKWTNMHVLVTVNNREEKDLVIQGIGNGPLGETVTVKLSDFTVNEGDQYKIEVYSDGWQDKYVDGIWTMEDDYTYKVSIGDFILVGEGDDTPASDAVKILPRASWDDEAVKGTLVDTTTAAEAFNTATLTVESASGTNFGSWIDMHVLVTVNGEETDLIIKGTGNGTPGETATVKLSDFTVNKGDQYKIEVYSDAWFDQYKDGVWTMEDDYTYKVSIGNFTLSETPDTPSENPSTPPTGDEDTSNLTEVQTSSWADTKKLATIIPQTTAAENYNTATVTVQCASDVQFNEYSALNVVVTVNGKAVPCTQKGSSDDTGAKSTYEIKEKFAIKAGDTYKVEAYTDSWESHTSSYVFKVGVTLGYEASDVDLEQGKLYYGKNAVVVRTSKATANIDSMTFEVECAADTSFNPWASIEFKVIVNGIAHTFTVEGTDENYELGAIKSCTIDNLGIKTGDYIRVEALTNSWSDASDYVFKLTAQDVESALEPSSSEIEELPMVEPTKETPKPAETTSPEPTDTPSDTPTDMPSDPTDTPAPGPTDKPSDPTGTESPTEPTKAPALKKGDEITKSGNTYEVASASAKTVKYVKAENGKKSSVTVPATVQTTVNGKKVTYKVVGIEDNAFKNDKNLKKITIGSNVKTIGKNAFKGCSNLTKVIIKSTSITKVDQNALKGTSKKLVIQIPKKAKYANLFKSKGNSTVVVKKI